jgi:hypothetical protein
MFSVLGRLILLVIGLVRPSVAIGQTASWTNTPAAINSDGPSVSFVWSASDPSGSTDMSSVSLCGPIVGLLLVRRAGAG